MSIQKRARFEFKTPDEITSVSRAILNQFPSLRDSEVAVLELMINAVEHGNLGISFKEKTRLLEQDRVAEEIDKRLNDPVYSKRTAIIEIKEFADEVVVFVADDGNGFDWQPHIKANVAERTGFHGRGIPISRQFAKSLTYMGNGNKVIAVFNKS